MFDATDLMHPWAAGDGDEVTPTVSGSTADSLSQLNAMMKDIR